MRYAESHAPALPDVLSSSVEQRVTKLVEYLFGFDDTPPVTVRTNLREDLGFDSLNEIHLATELEVAFSIKVPEGAEMNFDTVGDVVDAVSKALSQQ